MSVTTWMFRGVAFWLLVPVVLHWLRSPVSKSALKMTLAETEPIAQNRLADRINSKLRGSMDGMDVSFVKGHPGLEPALQNGK
jgi:hypothetical protein